MRKILAALLPILALYPLALILVIGTDTLLGDAEFIRSFFLESKRETVVLILQDWQEALPWSLLLWIATRITGLRLNFTQQNVLLGMIALILLGLSLTAIYLPILFSASAITLMLLNWAHHKWLTPSEVAP